MLGKTEGKRRGQQRMSWLDSINDSMDMILANPEIVKDREAWDAEVHGGHKESDTVTEQQQNRDE